MTRVLASACVVVLLLVGGRAWAGPGAKTTIAILGLEVRDSGTGIDPETTRVAKDLTAALRARADAGAFGPVPAPNSQKELIDEKLLNNCDTEAAVCMAAIGVELSADLLLFGKIEKGADQRGQPIYKIDLKLLYVAGKQIISTSETLPVAEAAGVRQSWHAKNWYAKLVGATSAGRIVVTANVDRGTVYIDGETKGMLASGKLDVPGVAEGVHKLVIEPEGKGFQRFETQITVRTGETLQQPVTLAEMKPIDVAKPVDTVQTTTPPPQPSGKSSFNAWQPVFYGTLALSVGSGVYSFYEWHLSKNQAGTIPSNEMTNGKQISHSTCGDMDQNAAPAPYQHALSSACSHYHQEIIGAVIGGVLGAAAIGAAYMAFIRDRDSYETQTANKGHRKRREFVVTPIVSPDGGGATLRIDW